jgi:hypothetical protein
MQGPGKVPQNSRTSNRHFWNSMTFGRHLKKVKDLQRHLKTHELLKGNLKIEGGNWERHFKTQGRQFNANQNSRTSNYRDFKM